MGSVDEGRIEAAGDILSHLETARTDAGPNDGLDVAGQTSVLGTQHANRVRQYLSHSAPPSGVDGRYRADDRIHQQHGKAVRGAHTDQHPASIRDDGVGLRPILPPWSVGADAAVGMDLVRRGQAEAVGIERGNNGSDRRPAEEVASRSGREPMHQP